MTDDILGLSDEAILAMDYPQEDTTQDDSEDAEHIAEDADETATAEADSEAPAEDANDDAPSSKETQENASDDADAPVDVSAKEDAGIDYKAFYAQLTAPFKANGRNMQVQNPDDMITLMQKGANYSKKMQEIKPKIHLLKTLENHQIDEQSLAFLVDLHKKDPKAIAKLVQDAKIDLYDFDTTQADAYTPTQIAKSSPLEAMVEELYESVPQFDDFLAKLGGALDDASKIELAKHPHILKVLSEHNTHGVFDKVLDAMTYEKMMGRMSGLSFLQGYQALEQQFLKPSFVDVRPKDKTDKPQNTTQKQRAKVMPQSATEAMPENVLGMSDEAFLKLAAQ